MKMTLSLTGSVAAITAAMQAFEAVEGKMTSASDASWDADYQRAGNAPQTAVSTSTGTGMPVAPATAPSAPSGAIPMPTAPAPMSGMEDDDADEGDETDGSGLDADGLPWDERIHSSSKKRGKDGTWNKRRGGPKGAELAAIEAELRANSGGTGNGPPTPPMPTATAEQPAPVAPTPPMPVPMPAPTAAPTAPAVPPMPTATAEQPAPVAPTPAPAPVAAPTGLDFPTLMQQIGPKMGEGEGQINSAYLQQVCQAHGLNSLTDLALKPELIDTVVAQFAADGRW